MLKNLLILIFSFVVAVNIFTSVNAAEVYQTIQVTEAQYPNINYYPRTLHINQGDTLHLSVKNTIGGYSRIFMPAINLDQDIAPGNVAQFDICFANPISKDMWFQISSPGAKKVPGHIITENFQIPIVCAPTTTADLSALDNIINYSKEYCYSEKEAPKYNLCPGKPVKGCW